MFEIGKSYEFHTLEDHEGAYSQVSQRRVVVAVDGPLIQFQSGEILNTHSPMFEKAVDVEEHKRWLDESHRSFIASLDPGDAEI